MLAWLPSGVVTASLNRSQGASNMIKKNCLKNIHNDGKKLKNIGFQPKLHDDQEIFLKLHIFSSKSSIENHFIRSKYTSSVPLVMILFQIFTEICRFHWIYMIFNHQMFMTFNDFFIGFSRFSMIFTFFNDFLIGFSRFSKNIHWVFTFFNEYSRFHRIFMFFNEFSRFLRLHRSIFFSTLSPPTLQHKYKKNN